MNDVGLEFNLRSSVTYYNIKVWCIEQNKSRSINNARARVYLGDIKMFIRT